MKIYVVGIGPGGIDELTPRAYKTLESCTIIAGYKRYVDLIRKYFPEKSFMISSMRQEIERCENLLDAVKENNVDGALISSGDAGVYGMAGLMLEIASGSGIEVEVVPGITAANSAAAVLGAPLMNDYVNISLSDLMTDWNTIAKRLVLASEGDFVICLYNPASNHRPENFKKACRILLDRKSPDTPAGYVRNIGREGQEFTIMTLNEIQHCDKIDMLTTVIIGNSQSYIQNGKIITPRGYKLE